MASSVVIITPTIGSPYLKRCVESVANQTYDNVKHLVVTDGIEEEKLLDVVEGCYWERQLRQPHPLPGVKLRVRTVPETASAPDNSDNLHLCYLTDNVGANGWYGHRIYAAFSYLVNEDYIIYLDEDNWIEPNHVKALITTIEDNNLLWAYSFRNIVDKEGEFICRDNCESLGWWPSVGQYNHVDTSSFCVKREVAVKVAHKWYAQWGADRQFYQALSSNDRYAPSREFSLNYRLEGNPGSPTKEFFLNGNKRMKDLYANGGMDTFPWDKGNGKNI